MIREVLNTIESFGLNPNRMMVEITESAMMTDDRATTPILAELHRRGLRVAVDDFGTGHSSLSRLTKMLVTTLKIDRSFVADLPGDRSAAILVKSIIQLAHNLGLQPLAEGIETAAQAQFLVSARLHARPGLLLQPAGARGGFRLALRDAQPHGRLTRPPLLLAGAVAFAPLALGAEERHRAPRCRVAERRRVARTVLAPVVVRSPPAELRT